jgi:hypothetical protein
VPTEYLDNDAGAIEDFGSGGALEVSELRGGELAVEDNDVGVDARCDALSSRRALVLLFLFLLATQFRFGGLADRASADLAGSSGDAGEFVQFAVA